MRLHVDALALSLSGISEPEGRELVRLIATRLAALSPTAAPPAIDRLRLDLVARPGERLDAMADRIASELLRVLARSS